MLVVGRARPRVSYNKTNAPRYTRSQPSSTMQPKQFANKKAMLYSDMLQHRSHQTEYPKPNADAMPARAFVNTERRFVFIFHTLSDSRFRMTVADDECRGSKSPWFQRTSHLAANLRSRPFHRSFDTASWWVVGSHTTAHSGSTSTATLLAFWIQQILIDTYRDVVLLAVGAQ
jgi:hypothetical protein